MLTATISRNSRVHERVKCEYKQVLPTHHTVFVVHELGNSI